MNAVAELRKYLAGFSARCRSAGWFGALFHVGVTQKIAEDVQAVESRAALLAYAGEQEDLEAVKLLTRATAQVKSTRARVLLTRAIRLVRASARHDRAAHETLNPA